MPLTVHPPTATLARREIPPPNFFPRPKGRSYNQLVMKRFVWSKLEGPRHLPVINAYQLVGSLSVLPAPRISPPSSNDLAHVYELKTDRPLEKRRSKVTAPAL